MMTVRHATILKYLCSDFIPSSTMRRAMMEDGMLAAGELTSKGRKEARRAIAWSEIKVSPRTSEEAQAWDQCQHNHVPPTWEVGDECEDCGAPFEYLKAQE